MDLVQFFTMWNFMGIVSSVVSLHYAFCKSIESFLQDFVVVLNSTQDTSGPSSSTNSRFDVKSALIEATDLHDTCTRFCSNHSYNQNCTTFCNAAKKERTNVSICDKFPPQNIEKQQSDHERTNSMSTADLCNNDYHQHSDNWQGNNGSLPHKCSQFIQQIGH